MGKSEYLSKEEKVKRVPYNDDDDDRSAEVLSLKLPLSLFLKKQTTFTMDLVHTIAKNRREPDTRSDRYRISR